jgi:hypothetical protein
MKSQWFDHKETIIELRKQGLSYGEIEKLFLVPRSTLSHWLRDIKLSDEQNLRLIQNYGNGLVKARVKASEWHKTQKELRIQKAKQDAEKLLEEVEINDIVVELALAMLYLGEGAKSGTTAIGNSNPLILKFFLAVLIRKYQIDPLKIRFDLHIRADQKPQEIKEYWANELNIPISSFKYIVADKRTEGRASYPEYKGVCIINCGNIAIQRKLIYLYNLFCQKVIDEWAISSVG